MKGTWRAVPCKQALITRCNLSRHSLLSTSNAPGQRGRGMEGWEMGGKQNRERREREDVRERGEWGQNKLWPRPLPPSLPHLLFSLIVTFFIFVFSSSSLSASLFSTLANSASTHCSPSLHPHSLHHPLPRCHFPNQSSHPSLFLHFVLHTSIQFKPVCV